MTMTFASPSLKDSCMNHQGAMEKLTSIRINPAGYGTPGPISFGNHARHAHITNKVGIAWTYDLATNDVHICALGKKHNRNKGRGDSGYDWDASGLDIA